MFTDYFLGCHALEMPANTFTFTLIVHYSSNKVKSNAPKALLAALRGSLQKADSWSITEPASTVAAPTCDGWAISWTEEDSHVSPFICLFISMLVLVLVMLNAYHLLRHI